MSFKGNGYLGSSDLQVSTVNMEVIPDAVALRGWTQGYALYKFEFSNSSACHVKINGGSPIFLKAGQGFSMDEGDKEITSFVIVESNITFNWAGAY
jgi:hypothetical protein